MSAATNMVISNGKAAKRVPIPKIKSIEQNTSEKTAGNNDAVVPTPIGSGNRIGPSPNNIESLPIPGVNIKIPASQRRSIKHQVYLFGVIARIENTFNHYYFVL